MRAGYRRLAQLGLTGCVSTAMVLATSVPLATSTSATGENASAQVAWSHAVAGYASGQIPLSSQGHVALAGCIQSNIPGSAANLYSATGEQTGAVNRTGRQYGLPCGYGATQVADAYGDVFFSTGAPLDSGVPADRIMAYTRAGAALWPRPAQLPDPCPSGDPQRNTFSMAVGADQNLYAVENGFCSGNIYSLLSFDRTTGALRFNTPLDIDHGDQPIVMPYNTGLVVQSRGSLRYFDYAGHERTSLAATLPATNEEYVLTNQARSWDVGVSTNAAGETFTLDADGALLNPANCRSRNAITAIAKYASGRRLWRVKLSYCTYLARINATPNGGVVVDVQHDPMAPDGTLTTSLLAFDAAGHSLWQRTLPNVEGTAAFGGEGHDALQGVDVNGNVVVQRFYTRVLNSDPAYYQYVVLDGSSGRTTRTIDTAAELPGLTENDTSGAGFGDGLLYTMLWTVDDAGSKNDAGFYAFKVPGLGLDYPRGALTSSAPGGLRYVALGDSYSSGEGNAPFINASADRACDRSAEAWPNLVSIEVPDVNLAGNLACSGATTTAFPDSYKGQQSQLSAMQALNPQVVTVTIGGDELGFGDALQTCYTDGLAHQQSKCVSLLTAMAPRVADFGTRLTDLYREVRSYAPKRARIVVVGYPRLFPIAQSDAVTCDWLSSEGRAEFNTLITELDQVTASAAATAGVQYVSTLNTLTDHELCTADSWVNPVTAPALHSTSDGRPMLLGQEAIAAAVAAHGL